ncbi:hypothetical protein TBLA_0H00360 [Henningerozyma blattae CBS 6284]|uniref:Uncharacterized protein n=1 Tax=Henningerozyma blattae (strain ATCC 34711 / CBS 6284 / DSM 70876 / NBRC 10599 / NRRL Y-10934 / UCD 77-7) TaxID=1071380 RepID=I2H7H7_HENB6|nr:hypothetical protein TBLA_0H00360 [Tetrapisispora blattae CBS 6284]CCH62329.1 hypothetical protein TBLA_0H00360 [Tetrapisispora blattae CBS 6284]
MMMNMTKTMSLRLMNRQYSSTSLLSSPARSNDKWLNQKRFTSTSVKQEDELLVAQRGKRPNSPHLTIYQPQLTWYLSSVNRISCCILGFSFYFLTMIIGFGALLGYDVNSKKIKEFYDKHFNNIFVKGAFAYLFAFQLFGTLRHLTWDMGYQLTLKGVYRTGYSVIACGTLLGTYLWLF